jgi:hypothetical protein
MKIGVTDKPSIGRVLHFVSAGHSLGVYNSTCRAAVCTDKKDDQTVTLTVFAARGIFFYEDVTYDEGKAGGTWHWPEREDAPTSSVLPANFVPPTGKPGKEQTGRA